MRTPYALGLVLTVLLVGTYWLTSAQAECRVPIEYRIGDLDARFGLSFEEARVVITESESVWEDITGRNLFIYDEDADFAINFVFDERQSVANAEETFREKLDASKTVNDAIGETYTVLVEKYEAMEALYTGKAAAYEKRLSTYNTEVAFYNTQGGAPEDVYEQLETEKQTLAVEVKEVNRLGNELNTLAQEVNRIGEKGNNLIENYNENVHTYNDQFDEAREFTQGDYQGDQINIYTFADTEELSLVVAHEFGHALALDHVENKTSIMYYLMGAQLEDFGATKEDLSEFEAVCGETERYEQWAIHFVEWKNKIGALY